MKINITVIKQGVGTKPAASQCPWIMDVPPEVSSR